MVRVGQVLNRVPVIKFRKGRAPSGSAAPSPSAAAAPAPAASAQSSSLQSPTQTCSLSTAATLPDINLPIKYRRTPLSQEEMDHINGGGIV